MRKGVIGRMETKITQRSHRLQIKYCIIIYNPNIIFYLLYFIQFKIKIITLDKYLIALIRIFNFWL